MSQIDLSIVITAHREGILLYKTLRSVFDAVKELNKNKIKFEVIIHIDNGDKETLDCIKKYSKKETIIIAENSFGSLSQSRNYAVSIARGKYVSFLDGDDLISRNWYIEALRVVRKNSGMCVVYPEAVLTFQDDSNYHVLTIQKKDNNTKEDYLTILSANRWGSVVMAKKELFLKVPYLTMGEGYCYEDYVFNIQTLECKIPHLIAPGTILFYRRLEGSMLTQANNDSLVLPRMDYFDLIRVDKKFKGDYFLEEKRRENELKNEIVAKDKTFRNNVIYKGIRGNWFLNYLVTPFLRLALIIKKKIKNSGEEELGSASAEKKAKRNIPDFVINGWREINKIEIQLYPEAKDLKGTILYDAKGSIDVGKAYADLSHSFTGIPDYVFIVPWIIRGGADKVLINYINALLEIHPDWHIAVIATLVKKNVWAHQLPKTVDLYELGNAAQFLNEGGKDVLMTLIITQLGCKRLHIINSELGYCWIKNHNTLVKGQYEVNVSFFAGEKIIEWDGGERIVSYENPCLFDIFPNVRNVFTDNRNIMEEVIDRNGFDENKFKIHYQPIDLPIRKRKISKNKTKKVLWAGRISTVKMPELVLEIGKNINDDIQIDIYGVIDDDCYNEQMFNEAKNVQYCGKYNSFSELPIDDYDLFLYTSKNDGVPNTILEAAAVGLPIMASNDGGVGEFVINNQTGILIEDFKKPDEYVREIRNVYNDKYDLDKLVKNSQELLKKRHSKDEFIKLVKKDIG